MVKILYTETGNDMIKATVFRNDEYFKENICNGVYFYLPCKSRF